MLKKFFITFLILAIYSFNLSVFAAISPVPRSAVAQQTTLTTAKFTWEKVKGALGYYVYYSKEQGKNYKVSDPVEDNTITLTNLEPNVKYYVVVTAFDESGTESAYSPETSFITGKSDSFNFGLADIKAKDFDKIELIFNLPLENTQTTQREFKITQNDKIIAKVKESIVDDKDPTKLLLTLDKKLTAGEYVLTIIMINSKDGKNIEEGVDGETKLTIPKEFQKEVVNNNTNTQMGPAGEVSSSGDVPPINNGDTSNTTSQGQTSANNTSNNGNGDINSSITSSETKSLSGVENKDGNIPELNSAGVDNSGIFGTSVNSNGNNPESISKDSKKLPQSGPEQTFILLFSLMLAGIFLFFRKKVLVK